MREKSYNCSKCDGLEYEKGQLRMAGGFWSKIFDVQNKKFTSITCKNCGYTEIYKKNTRTAENIFDFLTN